MKTFFNTKSVRERVLMTALLLVAVVLWVNSLLGRSRQLQLDWKTTAADIEDQTNWFKNKTQVDERIAKVSAQLDPSRTLNATQAFAEVNRLAQGLPVEIGATRTERSENFAMHSLQVTIRQTGVEPLLKFYKELSLKAPYLGIDQCSISVIRSAAVGQVNVVLRIYSVEVLRPASP